MDGWDMVMGPGWNGAAWLRLGALPMGCKWEGGCRSWLGVSPSHLLQSPFFQERSSETDIQKIISLTFPIFDWAGENVVTDNVCLIVN